MKRFIFILIAALVFTPLLKAQHVVREYMGEDGIPVVEYSAVTIWEIKADKKRTREIENQMKKFNKIRYNVIKVYPYAVEAGKNMKVITAELARISNTTAKETYLKSREHFLFGKYEKELKDLTISQGKILVKLIDRQTGSNTYSLIADLKSPATAFFWQGLGKILGYNLKTEYQPEEDDRTIEFIVLSIENGTNPTYFDYVEAAASKP